MKSSHHVNTAATLQAVYLVWLFLRITTMCNLSVFGLICGKFPELFAHAQNSGYQATFPSDYVAWVRGYYLASHHTALCENGIYKVLVMVT